MFYGNLAEHSKKVKVWKKVQFCYKVKSVMSEQRSVSLWSCYRMSCNLRERVLNFCCCTSVLVFHSINLQITSKLLPQGYRYDKLRKAFEKLFRSFYELLSKFVAILFQEYVTNGISQWSQSFTVILCTDLEGSGAQLMSLPLEQKQ